MNSADDGDAMIKLTNFFKQVIRVSAYDDPDDDRGSYHFLQQIFELHQQSTNFGF